MPEDPPDVLAAVSLNDFPQSLQGDTVSIMASIISRLIEFPHLLRISGKDRKMTNNTSERPNINATLSFAAATAATIGQNVKWNTKSGALGYFVTSLLPFTPTL
ncbi:hypothetical protein [Alicyclobacillus shizuokensis]|uniref:hypothetical protein n=1 Tax=Alicyclobacillus shizuokensis TaxID=392014 RepID=UPI000A419BFB|nr:hypothetical protein [Alicyclobacillus shizuokensis]MCL6625337.1 hypothetical protein [Alicyclobacillus shizuokensis]